MAGMARHPTKEGHMASTTETETQPAKAKKEPTPAMSAERAAWVAANARPKDAPCLCGCGATTKTRFFPGHDALLKRDLTATKERGTKAAKRDAEAALATFGW
jgi:hypothetical protein